MPEYIVEWTITGTTKVVAATLEEAEERPRHMGFDEMMFIRGTGIPTVTSFETRVQGVRPREIRVYRDGDVWGASIGNNPRERVVVFAGSPEAAVQSLLRTHPEVLE